MGGTDSQRPVMTSEFLDLTSITLRPFLPKEDLLEDESEERWIEMSPSLPSWHNGSAGLMGMNNNQNLGMWTPCPAYTSGSNCKQTVEIF